MVGTGRTELDEGVEDEGADGIGDKAGGEHEGEHARADLGAASERDHGGDGRRVDGGGERQREGLGGHGVVGRKPVRRSGVSRGLARGGGVSDTGSRQAGSPADRVERAATAGLYAREARARAGHLVPVL